MSKKMLYVRSKDYWGYDASDFDSSMNFYTYTWVVPEAMYNSMDDAEQVPFVSLCFVLCSRSY